MTLRSIAAIALAVLLFASCRPTGQVGEACTVTGDGFTRKDSCATMCVNWEITCPSGGAITPDVCSGAVCGQGGACPSGQECVQIDSVPANSRCMPVAICAAAAPPAAPGLPEVPGDGPLESVDLDP